MNIQEIKSKLQKSVIHLGEEFTNIRAVGAHPSMLNKIEVDYYGSKTPLNQVSTVMVQNGTSLVVTPFDKSILKDIVAAISAANIGLNASVEGEKIRVPVPPLNQEKREQYVKEAKEIAEKAKIAVRNIRHDLLHDLEKKDGVSEDEVKKWKADIQKEVDATNSEIESTLKTKIENLMKV